MAGAQGHLDWITPHASSTVAIFNDGFRLWANNEITQFLPVANFSHVWVNYLPNADSRLVVEFWNDNQGLLMLSQQTYDVSANQGLGRAVPVIGQFIRMYTQFVGASANVFGFNATALTSPLDLRPFFANNVLLDFGGSIAAGATVNTMQGFSYNGPATLHMSTAAAVWTFFLDTLDYTGANITIVKMSNTIGGGATIPVTIPNRRLRARFTNNDAAAKSYEVHIVSGA